MEAHEERVIRLTFYKQKKLSHQNEFNKVYARASRIVKTEVN